MFKVEHNTADTANVRFYSRYTRAGVTESMILVAMSSSQYETHTHPEIRKQVCVNARQTQFF